MNKYFLISLLLFLLFPFFSIQEVFENYILIYGEGPYGQHPLEFEVRNYTKDDAENIAIQEIATYMSGIIYGYTFEYQIDNPINKRKDFFEFIPVKQLTIKDTNFDFRQYEISNVSIRVQGIYRLYADQKSYIQGYRTARVLTSQGEYDLLNSQDWNNRYKSFELAVKNAILNYAKTSLKSRPLTIKGKLNLRESPKFSIASGAWRVRVKINLIITEIEYQD